MFIEKLESIDLGEPIYGRTIVGCAPKGATTSQLCLPFYKHFTATRFFRQTQLKQGCELEVGLFSMTHLRCWTRWLLIRTLSIDILTSFRYIFAARLTM